MLGEDAQRVVAEARMQVLELAGIGGVGAQLEQARIEALPLMFSFGE